MRAASLQTACRRARRALTPVACALLAAAPPVAQAGDHPGEEQPPLPTDLAVPPAPARA